MRVFISGKITGMLPSQAGKLFKAAQEKLEGQGFEVMNPFEVTKNLPQMKHSEYMEITFTMLKMCDAVYFLSNWRKSKGATQERAYAKAYHKRLLYENPEDGGAKA